MGTRSMSCRWWAAAAGLAVATVVAAVAAGGLPPGTECIPILTELEPCLPFVQQEHSGEQPTPDCCAVLKDVHHKSASCLCRLLHAEQNQPPTPGINLTMALLLPGACHLKVNPSRRCPALLGGDSLAPPPFQWQPPPAPGASAAKPLSSSSSSRRCCWLLPALVVSLASTMVM